LSAGTLYDKVWDLHRVAELPGGSTQLFIGLHLIHEVTTPQAFAGLRDLGLSVLHPERTVATVDHIVPTTSQARPFADPLAEAMLGTLERNCADYGITLHTESELRTVDAEGRKVALAAVGPSGNDLMLPYDLLHVVPRQSAPDWIKSSPLSTGDANGFVEIDKHTMQHSRYPNVFSLGDVGSSPNAKTGAAVRKQAPVVVENIDAHLNGRPLTASYDGYSSCPIVTSSHAMLLAEFDYDLHLEPSFPLLDPSKPHRAYWYLKKYGLPFLYWNLMLKGLA
jgi:sulfide:quinone oxidoreductase